MRRVIHYEIRDSKFSIIVNKARDEAKGGTNDNYLTIFNKNDLIQKHFLYVVYMNDSTTLTLKQKVCNVLSCNDFRVEHI
jgi:ATP adenylyltransferase/5',5'''-P-1,P-4-tetraphosphate phosphorylase II